MKIQKSRTYRMAVIRTRKLIQLTEQKAPLRRFFLASH
jgi:hypothetical protein